MRARACATAWSGVDGFAFGPAFAQARLAEAVGKTARRVSAQLADESDAAFGRAAGRGRESAVRSSAIVDGGEDEAPGCALQDGGAVGFGCGGSPRDDVKDTRELRSVAVPVEESDGAGRELEREAGVIEVGGDEGSLGELGCAFDVERGEVEAFAQQCSRPLGIAVRERVGERAHAKLTSDGIATWRREILSVDVVKRTKEDLGSDAMVHRKTGGTAQLVPRSRVSVADQLVPGAGSTS